jgi:hypothetical protein
MTNQGTNSINSFHGLGASNAIKLFYGDSAELFAKIIKDNLLPGKYTLADLSGHKGELLNDILNKLNQYDFDAVIIDKIPGLDNENIKAKKIVNNIINNEIPDKSIDIVIMRYVLPWDKYENQTLILKEVRRICRGIAIIQHQGAPDENPEFLQKASLKLWSGIIPSLKRDSGFFTEAKQIENWMSQLNIQFHKAEQKYITSLSEMFIEKFKLNDHEAKTVKEILRNCDGITITTWLLKFK